MQALGSYHGRRMLFLGLGTGLGSTLVWERNVLPLELGDLPYDGGITNEDLGKRGLARLGHKIWHRDVEAVPAVEDRIHRRLRGAGGGNAKKFEVLPKGVERGHNRNAFLGGTRLWQIESHTRRPKWRIL